MYVNILILLVYFKEQLLIVYLLAPNVTYIAFAVTRTEFVFIY